MNPLTMMLDVDASVSVNSLAAWLTADTPAGPSWTSTPSSLAARVPPVATSEYIAITGAGAASGPTASTLTTVTDDSSISPWKAATTPSTVTRAPTVAFASSGL